MQIALGHRPVPQCPEQWRRSGFLGGRPLARNVGCYKRYSQRLVTCKQRGQKDDEAPISPPNPLQNLFGGTKRIKAEAEQQAPPQRGRPGKGTQKLKLGGNPFSGGNTGKGGGTKAIGTSFLRSARKDPNTVFVAGATGRLGARIVKMLLEKNNQIKVRAGVRDVAKATEYLQTATSFGLLPQDANKRVQLVQVDITDPESIAPAIGSASKVVQAIGAPESEALNFGNPKKIDGDGAIALVEAAVAAGIDQYVMVTSLGTAKVGFPAAVLNLFGGILIQKRRAEVALENSGLNYVIVRPGGMERPTDSYKDTHNVRLSTADTLFGGQVSRWQVAELVAAAVATPSIAENKILEVVAEETAPLRSYEDLLSAAPSDISQADKVAKKQAQEEAAQQLEQARQKVAEAQEAAQEAKELVQEQTAVANAVRRQAEESKSEAGPILRQVEQNEQQLKKLRAEAEQSQRKEAAAKAVLAAAKDAAREGRALSKDERSAVERPILSPEEAPEKQAAPRAAQQKPRPAASKPKVPPMPVQAKTQEEAAAKAKEAFNAQPKASAKTGRSFFERLKPEKASAPAQAPVAAKTKEEAIAISKNVSSRQQAPQADRTPAPPKKAPAPVDPKEAERRREAAAKAAAEARSIEERVLRAVEEEREKKEAAARAKRRDEDRKRQEAEAKQRREVEAKIKAEIEATTKRRTEAYGNRPKFTPLPEAKKAETPMAKKTEMPAAKKTEKAQSAEKAPRGKNADEARGWIEAWRKGPKGPMQPVSKAGSDKPGSSAESNGAAKEPKSEGAGKAKSGKDEEVPDNVREAREWIRSWRASKLEASLPEDVKANSK